MKDQQDTSSISFTAHYTGFVWYRFGLSHSAFATRQGCTYFQLLEVSCWSFMLWVLLLNQGKITDLL